MPIKIEIISSTQLNMFTFDQGSVCFRLLNSKNALMRQYETAKFLCK